VFHRNRGRFSRIFGDVFLALHEGKVIAAAIFFRFADQALYKFGASDRRLQHLRANNLIFWEAIQRFHEHGYSELLLGRTDAADQGLRRFKIGWNATEQELKYYRYDLRAESFVADEGSKGSNWRKAIVRRLPIRISRAVGRLLYRHTG